MKINITLLFIIFSLQANNVLADAITIGDGTKADENSIAIGEDAWAIQTAGHDVYYATGQVAIGYHAKAKGLASTAYGAYSLATGFKSSAYGDYSQANGYKSTAFGPDSIANGDYSTAFGSSSQASGLNSLAIGANTLASKDNSIALGSGSTADTGSQFDYVGYMLSQPQTSNGELSIGSTTVKRKITNVAAGENDSDATNVEQLKAVNNDLTSKIDFNSDRSVNYDLNQDGSINLLSLSLNKGSGNVVLRGVANGAVSSTSTEAINGSQLYQTNQQVSTLQDSLSSLYTMVGTTNTKLDATTAQTTQNTQDIADTNTKLTTTNSNVAQNTSDIQNLSTNAGSGTGTGSSAADTQNATDIANTNTELSKTNVQVTKNTNDINKNTQDIATTNTKVSQLDNKTVQYDQDGSGNNLNKITLKGQGGSVISNVADGQADSDAVNVKQLKTVSTQTTKNTSSIKSISEGKTGMVIVNNTSNKASPIATGKDSIAIGQGSKSTGNNSVAIGSDSSDNGRDNTVSIGNSTVKRTLSNVSAGTLDTDAVNVSQLNSQVNSALNNANAYTDSLFSGLNNKIDKVEKQNKAGIASAMAMATMPQAYDPGDSMISFGVGAYSSESAISVGASVASPKGKFIYKINGSMDSRGTAGAAAGVGYKW